MLLRFSEIAFFLAKAILFLPFALFFYLISPFFLIQIGRIRAERIGHLSLDLELSFCREKELMPRNKFQKKINLFFIQGQVSNEYLLNLWKKKINILPIWLLLPIHNLSKNLPGHSRRNFFDWVERNGHSDFSLLDKYPPMLEIPSEDIAIGKKILQDLGIEPNQKHVCFAVRDSEYLKRAITNTDWSYHDYRDSDIINFLEAAEFLTSRGYAVIRMGKLVKNSIESNNPLIIDYANSVFRSDFADVFLFPSSYFTISTSSGMDSLATIFRVPLGLVNIVNERSVSAGNQIKLFQPKSFLSKVTKRPLTLQEISNRNLMSIDKTLEFDLQDIELRENSPHEIRDFVEELLDIVESETDEREPIQILEGHTGEFIWNNDLLQKLARAWLKWHPDYLS